MVAPEPPLTKLYTGLILGAGDQLENMGFQ